MIDFFFSLCYYEEYNSAFTKMGVDGSIGNYLYNIIFNIIIIIIIIIVFFLVCDLTEEELIQELGILFFIFILYIFILFLLLLFIF